MCLIVKEGIKIAEEDIVVYKILSKCSNKEKTMATYGPPYQCGRGFKYKKGVNSDDTGFEGIFKRYDDEGPYTVVESGFLHAFTDLDFALYYLKVNFSSTCLNSIIEYHVYEMIIPKGTRYFVGEQNDICAKELRWDNMTPCD